MNNLKEWFLSIPLDDSSRFKFTQLPLHETFNETRWRPSNCEDPQKLYSPLPGKNETLSDPIEIETLLKESLFVVIGTIIQKITEQNPIVYYLVLLPNQKKTKSVFFVQKHRNATESINKRFKIASVLKNLNDPMCWKIPHQRVYLHFIDGNECPFDLFVVAHQVILIGCGNLRNQEVKVNEFDYLVTGRRSNELQSRQQVRTKAAAALKQKRLEPNDVLSFKHDRVIPNAHAFTLNENTRNRFLNGQHSSDCTDPIRSGYGIRSVDSGGLVKLFPIISDQDESSEPIPLTKSEMHVVTENPNVFHIKHSFRTINAAIENFRTKCEESGETPERIDELLGAIASRFLEDISWQLVADSTVNADHLFKNIQVDIDQVSSIIFM
jgi:hypothetical protein